MGLATKRRKILILVVILTTMSFIFYILLFSLKPVLLTNTGSVNVGTVLFTQQDVKKSCWTVENVALLTTRMLLEDLMPPIDSVVVNSDDYVTDLIEYFRDVLKVVRQESKGRRKHVVLLALTDILGGYLKSVVVPRAKYAYYAGLIDFLSIEKILQFYEEMKWFLRTNGIGWAKPIDNGSEDIKVNSINLDVARNNASCDSLIFYENPPIKANISENTHRVSTLKPRNSKKTEDYEPRFVFPIPFLDKRYHPGSIAVPFKHYTLRSIESKKASSIIFKFFVTVYTCMAEKKVDIRSRKKFYDQFFTWLMADVMPKLDDDNFYSAFGGVLKVEHTLRDFGAEEVKLTTFPIKMTEEGLTEKITTIAPALMVNDKSKMICLILIILLFIWFLLGILFICYKIRYKKKDVKCACRVKSSKEIVTTDSDSRTLPKCSCTTSATESKSKLTAEQKSPPETTAGFHMIEDVRSLKLLPSIAEISEISSKKSKLVYHSDEGSLTSESSSYSLEENSKNLAVTYAKISDGQFVKRKSRESITSRKNSSVQSTELTTSEVTSIKQTSSTSQKDSSDFSTDATSQIIKTTASSDGKPAELHISYDQDTPGTSKTIPVEKRYCFGYDFHTSSSGESTSESEESSSGNRSHLQ